MMVFFLNGTSLLRSISGPGSWGKIMTVKFSLPNAPRSIYFFFSISVSQKGRFLAIFLPVIETAERTDPI